MDISASDLAALEEKRRRQLKEIQADLEALSRVRRMLGGNSTSIKEKVSESTNEVVVTEKRIPSDQLSLIDAISQLVFRHPGRLWNVRNLEAALLDQGFEFASRRPRGSISNALARLTDRGELVLIKEGSGPVPSTYRVLVESEENEGA